MLLGQRDPLGLAYYDLFDAVDEIAAGIIGTRVSDLQQMNDLLNMGLNVAWTMAELAVSRLPGADVVGAMGKLAKS